MTQKILFPVDGSAHALKALQQWFAQNPQGGAAELHLLNVQLPVDGNVTTFVSQQALNDYHRTEGLTALAPIHQWLQAQGHAYHDHILVGHPADVICRFAQERGMNQIVMASHGRTGLLDLIMGSVATEVKAKATVPVTVIAQQG